MMSDKIDLSIAEDHESIHTPFRGPETQIRLLHLNAEAKADSIAVSLETWDIESAPPDNAISYAWGAPSERHAITVNGIRLPVRKNCFHALKQVRLHYPECHVWMDAICINQVDLDEKSAQVAMMGSIYKKAALVLSCIGPADAFIQTSQAKYGEAIFQKTVLEESMDEDMERKRNGTAGVMEVDISTMTHRWYPDGLGDDRISFPANEEDQALITRLCGEWNTLSQRPYFGRAWIVQELAGGTDFFTGRTIILSGRDSIGWTRLVALCYHLNTLITNPVTDLTMQQFDLRILTLNGLIYRGGHFTKYLEAMAYLECQDARDRIFSTVSLIDWESYGQARLFPDYRMSRLQLASQLMWRLIDMDMGNVRLIATALDLGDEAPQMLNDPGIRGLPSCPGDDQPDVARWWPSGINSAYIIDQNTAGRFQIRSQIPLRGDIEFMRTGWPTKCDAVKLARGNTFPHYLGETLIAFADGQIRPGDILLSSDCFDLVLRACSDAAEFRVIGGAFVPIQTTVWLHQMRKANICDCWQGTSGQYVGQEVRICVEATRGEALANAVARKAITAGTCSIVEYMQRYAIGALRTGSSVWDTTTDSWHEGSTLGPPLPQCPAHKASELHRILRNPVWYNILSSGGPYIEVDVPA